MNDQQLSKLTLPEKVLEHIAASSVITSRALASEKQAQDRAAKVAALAPQVVATLADNGRILPGQQAKVAEVLKDHAKTLELLMKVAAHRNEEEQSLAASKTASHRPSPKANKKADIANAAEQALCAALGIEM